MRPAVLQLSFKPIRVSLIHYLEHGSRCLSLKNLGGICEQLFIGGREVYKLYSWFSSLWSLPLSNWNIVLETLQIKQSDSMWFVQANFSNAASSLRQGLQR